MASIKMLPLIIMSAATACAVYLIVYGFNMVDTINSNTEIVNTMSPEEYQLVMSVPAVPITLGILILLIVAKRLIFGRVFTKVKP